MEEDYALSILKREQQIISRDTQLQGPGLSYSFEDQLIDWRQGHLRSLGNAIDLIEKKRR